MNKQTFVIKQGCVSYRKTHSYKNPRLNLNSSETSVKDCVNPSEIPTSKCVRTNRSTNHKQNKKTSEISSQEPSPNASRDASTGTRQCSSLKPSSVTSINPNQDSSRMAGFLQNRKLANSADLDFALRDLRSLTPEPSMPCRTLTLPDCSPTRSSMPF